jgi:hypothetical protein
MDSITATPDSQNRSVLLTAINPVGDVTWTRNTSGGALVLGVGPSLRDYPPFGFSVIYEATDSATTEVADPLTLPDPDKAVLTNTLTGMSRDVVVVSQLPQQQEGRSKAHFVLGRPEPVVTIQAPQYPTGTLRLHAATFSDVVALRELRSDGGVLRLRRPSSHASAVDDMTLLVDKFDESLVSDSAPAGARYVDIEYQAVSEITYNPVDPTWTYDALVIERATYSDARAAYATYTALAAGPPA